MLLSICDCIITGDAFVELKNIPDRSVDACITGPNYWKQEAYQIAEMLGEKPDPSILGCERSVDGYIMKLRVIFSQVRRILKSDGTLWVTMDDAFQNHQLQGIPTRLAMTLQQDAWIWQNDIIWFKNSENSYEHLLMFTKMEDYYGSRRPLVIKSVITAHGRRSSLIHIDTIPEEIVQVMILQSVPPEGTVLDPFCGAGTVPMVAQRLNRHYIGIEINKDYADHARGRLEA